MPVLRTGHRGCGARRDASSSSAPGTVHQREAAMEFHFPHCALIHLSAWKGNSRKSAYSVVHMTPPQSPKARSSRQPHSMIVSYILWCWIDIRDRECFTAAVDLD